MRVCPSAIPQKNLFCAGKDVTLLAWEQWRRNKTNGLRIKDKVSPRISVSRIPTVTELKPDDEYDVIFVVMRYTQIDSVPERSASVQEKTLVFAGNNVRSAGLAALLPEKNCDVCIHKCGGSSGK